jgi:hypothetical protein
VYSSNGDLFSTDAPAGRLPRPPLIIGDDDDDDDDDDDSDGDVSLTPSFSSFIGANDGCCIEVGWMVSPGRCNSST